MRGMSLIAILAAHTAWQPSIASIEPQGVRSGGSFVVQVDTSSVKSPIVVVAIREQAPKTQKHVSQPLTDNGPGDDAPQDGVIKYRISTDDTWLSMIGQTSTSLATTGVKYKVAVSVTRGTVDVPATSLTGKPPDPAKARLIVAQPTLEAIEVSRVVTVLASAGVTDVSRVIDGDFDSLRLSSLSLALKVLQARGQGMGSIVKDAQEQYANVGADVDVALKYPNRWLATSDVLHYSGKRVYTEALRGAALYDRIDPTILIAGLNEVANRNYLTEEYAALQRSLEQLSGALSEKQKQEYSARIEAFQKDLEALRLATSQ